MRTFIEKIIIYEDKMYPLCRYLKDGKRNSDHNTMIMHLNITFMEKRQDKIEMFNLKNSECQKDFFQLTEMRRDLVKGVVGETSRPSLFVLICPFSAFTRPLTNI